MSIDSLLSKIKRLKKEFVEPAGPVTLSAEWIAEKAFTLDFLQRRYPNAYLTMIAAYDQIETEDRARVTPNGLQLKRKKGKIPWAETKEGRLHILSCKVNSYYGTLGKICPEACIAMAEEISRQIEERES